MVVGPRRGAGKRFLVLFVAMALILGACGNDDDDAAVDPVPTDDNGAVPSDDGEVCTEDRRGGTVTYGTGVEIAGVDPTVALGTGFAGLVELLAMYDPLMRYDVDTGEYVPFLAESLEPNDDLTEWTVRIREGITYGNGDPVTVDALQLNIERLAESARQSAGLAQQIIDFEIVDDHTIVLTNEGPTGMMPHILSTEVGLLVNPAVLEERGEDDFPTNPTGAGTGPFEFDRLVPGEELVFTAKDDWWGGPVCIETLRFINIAGAAGTWEAVQAGEVQVAILSDVIVSSEAREAGAEAFSGITGSNGTLFLNHRDGHPTSDLRVRQAVAHALDPELIDDRVFDGMGLPSTGLAHPDMRIYPGIDGLEFDPERASELAEQAKADGWDGTLVLVGTDLGTAVDTSIVIEALLGNVGIEVIRENLPPAEANERILFENDYDLAMQGIALVDTGPYGRLSRYHSTSPNNRPGVDDAGIDAALEQLRVAVTEDEIVDAMAELQTAWNEVLPLVTYTAGEWFIAADHDVVRGLAFTADVTTMFHQAYVVQ